MSRPTTAPVRAADGGGAGAVTNASPRDLAHVLEHASPRMGAGILLVCNHMLDLAARTWNADLLDHPDASPPASRRSALEALRHSRDVLVQSLEWRLMDDSIERQIASTDLALITLSAPDGPRYRQASLQGWRALWAFRGALPEALASIRDWEADTGAPAFPRRGDGSYPTDHQALALGNRFPAFLRAFRKEGGR